MNLDTNVGELMFGVNWAQIYQTICSIFCQIHGNLTKISNRRYIISIQLILFLLIWKLYFLTSVAFIITVSFD